MVDFKYVIPFIMVRFAVNITVLVWYDLIIIVFVRWDDFIIVFIQYIICYY